MTWPLSLRLYCLEVFSAPSYSLRPCCFICADSFVSRSVRALLFVLRLLYHFDCLFTVATTSLSIDPMELLKRPSPCILCCSERPNISISPRPSSFFASWTTLISLFILVVVASSMWHFCAASRVHTSLLSLEFCLHWYRPRSFPNALADFDLYPRRHPSFFLFFFRLPTFSAFLSSLLPLHLSSFCRPMSPFTYMSLSYCA